MDGYLSVRRRFIEVIVSTLAMTSAIITTARCCICNRTYGEPVVKDATAVLFQELPYHDAFMPGAVEQITIPCGHQFCIPCIGKWLCAEHTCPMCRQPVDFPDLSGESEDDHLSTQIEGFILVYHVSEWRAREVCSIHRLSMSQLLTTPMRMPLVWLPVNMVFDPPRVMVMIVRRFHHKSIRHPVPSTYQHSSCDSTQSTSMAIGIHMRSTS